MFNFSFFNKKLAKDLAQEITSHTEKVINKQSDRLEEIHILLSNIYNRVDRLEKRFSQKDIQDKHTYGHLKYKIEEINNDITPVRKKSS
jgi:predicted metal-dependent enzyme (double-stranded beta helix superfamily)